MSPCPCACSIADFQTEPLTTVHSVSSMVAFVSEKLRYFLPNLLKLSRMEIYFSNQLEILYQHLKQSLFSRSTKPLTRRLVMVQSSAMRNWLTLRMAQDPELNVAMGIEFIYLSQAFETLLRLSTSKKKIHFPRTIEVSLSIEAELFSVFKTITCSVEKSSGNGNRCYII